MRHVACFCLACTFTMAVAAVTAAEDTPRVVAGSRGPIAIPFTMPSDGEASVGLYNAGGRLVRPLAQCVALEAGPHVIRWDGLDLWGNVVPAETALTAKVITNPGLRVRWEFGAVMSNPVPWVTRPFGEGEAMRCGGWLGDHSPPTSVASTGDRVYVGCFTAEHGHAMGYTNLDGEKMWGRGGFEGWAGPRQLATDGRHVYAAVKYTHLYRMPLTCEGPQRIADTGPDRILGLAAHDGRTYLLLENHKASESPLDVRIGAKDVDTKASVPPVTQAGSVPHQQLNHRERFATVFFRGGHSQTGVQAQPGGPEAKTGRTAVVAAAFARPVTVGSLLVERVPGAAKAEVYALAPGVAFDASAHAPAPDADVDTFTPGKAWRRLGELAMDRRLSVVTAPEADLRTRALLVRLTAEGEGFTRPPKLTMCRVLPHRVRRADAGAALRLPEGVETAEVKGAGKADLAWHLRTARPITERNQPAVVLALPEPREVRGLCLLNLGARQVAIDAYAGPADRAIEDATEDDWRQVGEYAARDSKRTGWSSCSPYSNEVMVDLGSTVTTRALRVRHLTGYGGGRVCYERFDDDVRRADCADVAILALADPVPPVPPRFFQARDGETGDLVAASDDASVDFTAFAAGPDGTLYTVSGDALRRSVWDPKAEAFRHTVLSRGALEDPISVAVSQDGARIAVGDSERDAVVVFDPAGQRVQVIGDVGPRQRGPWNPQTVDRPHAMAYDRLGRLWVVDHYYTPKRVTCCGLDGRAVIERLGPPHYGGGGYLAASLDRFWYEAIEYELDWKAGTSRPLALNDVQYDGRSPTLDAGSYSYTKVSRPVELGGRRYIVGDVGGQYHPGVVVCLLDPGSAVWRPAAVMGPAEGSPFLLRNFDWREHWLARDLTDSSFIWCDTSGDGVPQTDEVDLFKHAAVLPPPEGKTRGENPFKAPYWGTRLGPDLTFWGTAARIAPARVTERGVPIYRREDIEPFDYKALAPIYTEGFTAGTLAKRGYGGAMCVMADGSVLHEAQPYVVTKDTTLKGGPLGQHEQPTDYRPPILGHILDNPLSFVGRATTDGPLGEVAVMNGDNGRWYVISAADCLVVGRLFTGEAGGFGGLTEARRGMDVTNRKQDWECFFGSFTRAHDGRYYVVAGKGYHGISRVEGLNDYRVATRTVRVTEGTVAASARLRAALVRSAKAVEAARKQKKTLAVQPLVKRAKGFALDGALGEWGAVEKMRPLGGKDGTCRFDAACDAGGLVLAWAGTSGTGNAADEPALVFKGGFALDLRVRPSRDRGGQVKPGDRRLVFAPHKGRWIAVLYDYVAPDAPAEAGRAFRSPVTTTHVNRVRVLGADEVRVAFREVGATEDGTVRWTAEARVPWALLGLEGKARERFRADVGALLPDAGGLQVGRRANWSHVGVADHVSDLAVEAQIHPAAWGDVELRP